MTNKDENLIYPGKDPDFVFPEEGAVTEPTQAQIEAAAIAICKSKTCEGINCCQWPANGGKRRDARGQAVQCNAKLGAYDDAAKAALTAAAQIKETNLQMLERWDQEDKDWLCKHDAATIERCAREAEKAGAWGEEIAAAIRAIKDKP